MVTDRLGEAARLLRDAETEEPQCPAIARWMLDLARTHAAIAQAEATARLVDHLTYLRDKDWATRALLERPLTSHRAAEVCAIGDRALAAEAERDALARRMDAVRGFAERKAIAARALGRGDEERGWLDVILLLDGEGSDA